MKTEREEHLEKEVSRLVETVGALSSVITKICNKEKLVEAYEVGCDFRAIIDKYLEWPARHKPPTECLVCGGTFHAPRCRLRRTIERWDALAGKVNLEEEENSNLCVCRSCGTRCGATGKCPKCGIDPAAYKSVAGKKMSVDPDPVTKEYVDSNNE